MAKSRYSSEQEQLYKDRVNYYFQEAKNAKVNSETDKAKYFKKTAKSYENKYFGTESELFHGAIVSPKTMAMVCEDLGLIQRW